MLLPVGVLPGQSGFVTAGQFPVPELDNLIQGRLYAPDYRFINDSPYLLEEWLPGTVRYREREYSGQTFRYDVFADELILLNRAEEGVRKVQLTRAFVAEFSLGGRRFVNLDYSSYRSDDLPGGYYEVVLEDYISLLAKRTADIEHREALAYFAPRSLWFVVKDGQTYRIRNRKTLLAAFDDVYRKPIAVFLRKQFINLRRADDVQWLRVASYLNTLF